MHRVIPFLYLLVYTLPHLRRSSNFPTTKEKCTTQKSICLFNYKLTYSFKRRNKCLTGFFTFFLKNPGRLVDPFSCPKWNLPVRNMVVYCVPDHSRSHACLSIQRYQTNFPHNNPGHSICEIANLLLSRKLYLVQLLQIYIHAMAHLRHLPLQYNHASNIHS